jgi:hypothetical protein
LRRGWTKSWRCVSAAAASALLALASLLAAAAAARGESIAAAQAPAKKRVHELTLAGLRPGQATLEEAERRLGAAGRVEAATGESPAVWFDSCTGVEVRVEYDDAGVVQGVAVTQLAGAPAEVRCQPPAALAPERLRTGHGLGLGLPRSRVVAIYGAPSSTGPSKLAGQDTEFLYYAFDWAGSDVPQVLEVTADRATGRVVKILLAYPSL